MDFRTCVTPLKDVVLIEPHCYRDNRGFFLETWNARDFTARGLPGAFVQDSHSRSRCGVLRGLHYQDQSAPAGKLVRCTVGTVFDVAVDIRVGSPTFGLWYGVDLTAENQRQLYIPIGFAHGVQAISEWAEIQYKLTEVYTPAAEGAIAWDDPDIAIDWPITPPILSNRDQEGMSLHDYLRNPAFSCTTSSNRSGGVL